MCSVDLSLPSTPKKEEVQLSEENGPKSDKKTIGKKRKGKWGRLKEGNKTSLNSKKAVKVIPLKSRALFLGHTSGNSILVVEKDWAEVQKQLPPPFKYHKFGT